MSWLSTANKIFTNAEDREHRQHIIRSFVPVQNIISNSGKCFSFLKEEDDYSVKTLKWLLWNLRQAVVLSILPFNSDLLGLHEIVKELNRTKGYFPTVGDNVSEIIDATQYLLDNPENPKREKVFSLLKECRLSGEKHALVSLLCRGRIFGWGDTLNDQVRRISPECLIVSSRKILLSNAFDRIIIPSGGKSSPILNELLNCSYGKLTESVAYDREHTFIPERKVLPIATKNYSSDKKIKSDFVPYDPEENNVNDWEKNEYWDSFRSRHGLKSSADHGMQHIVKARLVVLPNNKIVYLRDDVKVINLTSIIGENISYLKQLKKFPRTLVRNLTEGDLIVLRTSGSGEYLLDVANMLMQKNGKGNLRVNALEWKSYLSVVLLKEGSFKIFNLLKDKGHDFSNHLYLWEWTTNDVIGPANDSKFFELIAILDDLGYLPNGMDVVQYAEEKWALMKELKRYHQQAGVYIRNELLDEMKRVIESGTLIEDQLTLNVKGVSSGALSVLRVVGVDPETQTLPYSEIGTIREIGV